MKQIKHEWDLNYWVGLEKKCYIVINQQIEKYYHFEAGLNIILRVGLVTRV